MRDLSMHVLDIAQNSVKAGAGTVSIDFTVDEKNWLTLTFQDDGCGMEPAFLATVMDPFTTTRTTRKVGLGLPLLKETQTQCGCWLWHMNTDAAWIKILMLRLSITKRARNLATLPVSIVLVAIMPEAIISKKTMKKRLNSFGNLLHKVMNSQ